VRAYDRQRALFKNPKAVPHVVNGGSPRYKKPYKATKRCGLCATQAHRVAGGPGNSCKECGLEYRAEDVRRSA